LEKSLSRIETRALVDDAFSNILPSKAILGQDLFRLNAYEPESSREFYDLQIGSEEEFVYDDESAIAPARCSLPISAGAKLLLI